MAVTKTKKSDTASKPRVGQRVRFQYSLYEVEGTITENYGPLARDGQDVYEIVAPQELAEPITAVLPASKFTIVGESTPTEGVVTSAKKTSSMDAE